MFMISGILSIAAAVWIYNQEEGGEAIVWAILTVLFSTITLVIYGVTHRSSTALLFAGGLAGLWIVQIITVFALHGPR